MSAPGRRAAELVDFFDAQGRRTDYVIIDRGTHPFWIAVQVS